MNEKSFDIIEMLNTGWKPAITSTPLKAKSTKWGNNNVKNVEFNKHENLLNSLINYYQEINSNKKSNKTLKKNNKSSKQSFHFDESSSSADEDVKDSNIKNLEVKINSCSNSRIKEKEIDIIFEETINSFLKNVKSKKKGGSTLKTNNRKNNVSTQNQDKLSLEKIKGPSLVNTNDNLKNSIKKKKTKSSKKIIETKKINKNSTKNKSVEKICNDSFKNVKSLINKKVLNASNNSQIINGICKSVENQIFKNTEKLNSVSNNKLEQEDDIIFKTPLKLNVKVKKNSNVAVKRKGNRVLNSNIPKKKVKKKQLQENIQNSIENYLKSPIEKEKKNTSHQLFSESREQELINSLNMTLQEGNNLEKKNCVTSNLNVEGNEKLQTSSEVNVDKDFKVLKMKKVLEVENENVNCDFSDKNSIMDTKNNKEQSLTEIILNKFESTHSPGLLKNSENNQCNDLNDDEINVKKNVDLLKENKKNFKQKHTNSDSKSTCEEKNETLSKLSSFQDVFKMTDQLTSFVENQPGCFTAECWSLKNFKCGVLKLKPKSKIGSHTAYDNSYFGGVILKGTLKIYIGKKKLELQQGGMVFVPPLTDWVVINFTKEEAMMYYWFGRFRA